MRVRVWVGLGLVSVRDRVIVRISLRYLLGLGLV